jgi:hypothetical protein
MTNEEIVEELLHEAEELKLRKEVLELASKIREASPKMSFLDSLELAFGHLKNHVI